MKKLLICFLLFIFCFSFLSAQTLSVQTIGNIFICSGDPVNICATASGGTSPYTYTWQPGNITGSCIAANPTVTTTYTVSVLDNKGTSVTASATVQVNPTPNVSFYASITQGCAPLCIQFYNNTTISSGGILAYNWIFGTGSSVGVESPVYCYPDSGHYSIDLTVISDSGCSETLLRNQYITVFALPKAAFTYSPAGKNTIQFINQSTGVPNSNFIVYYTWNFGDGDTTGSTLKNPIHTYSDTGTYHVSLATMDEHGCLDTTFAIIVIEPPCLSFTIPNVFTPDYAGIGGRDNEFYINASDLKTWSIMIYDRWGKEIYTSINFREYWNGNTKGGSQAPGGVYYYIVNATCESGSSKKDGYVQLIR